MSTTTPRFNRTYVNTAWECQDDHWFTLSRPSHCVKCGTPKPCPHENLILANYVNSDEVYEYLCVDCKAWLYDRSGGLA